MQKQVLYVTTQGYDSGTPKGFQSITVMALPHEQANAKSNLAAQVRELWCNSANGSNNGEISKLMGQFFSIKSCMERYFVPVGSCKIGDLLDQIPDGGYSANSNQW